MFYEKHGLRISLEFSQDAIMISLSLIKYKTRFKTLLFGVEYSSE